MITVLLKRLAHIHLTAGFPVPQVQHAVSGVQHQRRLKKQVLEEGQKNQQ
jgi:hypothetical protein